MSAKSFKVTTGVPTLRGQDPVPNSEVVRDDTTAESLKPSDKQCWLSCYGSDGADQFPYDRGKDDGVEGSGSGDGEVGVPANNCTGIPVFPKKKKLSKVRDILRWTSCIYFCERILVFSGPLRIQRSRQCSGSLP